MSRYPGYSSSRGYGSFSRESSSNLREDNSSRGGNGFDRGYGPVVRNTPGAPYGTVYSRESGENRGREQYGSIRGGSDANRGSRFGADRDREGFAIPQDANYGYGYSRSGDRGRGGRGGFGGGGDRGRPGHYGGAPNRSQSTMPESVEHKQLVKQGLGSGTEGRPVELLSNFFKINTDGKVVYHYSVDLKKVTYRPSDPKSGKLENYEIAPVQKGLEMFIKKASEEVLDMYFKQNPEAFDRVPFVHDGAQKLYSTSRLNLINVPEVQTFTIGGRDIRFAVLLQLVAKIDCKELDHFYQGAVKEISPAIVPVFEQVFRSVIVRQFTAHQSSYYDLKQRERTSNRAFEFVRGFAASVRLTEFGLAFNLHLKCSCMIERGIITVEQLLLALLKRNSLPNESLTKEELKRVNKILTGLKVQTKHTRIPGLYTIDALSHKTTVRHEFDNFEGRTTNVMEHFNAQYNMHVKNCNLIRTMTPLGGGGFGKRDADGKKAMIMLPIEACFLVPDQFIAEFKLPPLVQTEHLKLSTLQPNVYFPNVCRFVDTVSAIAPDLLTNFGLELTKQPVKFPARVLDLPTILTGVKNFHIPADAPKINWGVFCFDKTVPNGKLNSFVQLLIEAARKKGVNFNRPSPVSYPVVEAPEMVEHCLGNLWNIKQAEFVLVVIPSEHPYIDKNTIYNFVKFGENQYNNIISQCVVSEKVVNTPHGYYDNLLDKINAKLGGSNMLVSQDYIKDLPFKLSETMVVGADVNHPGMIEKVPLSIAALVGSYDSNVSQYSSDVCLQKKERTETINNIGFMLERLLAAYKSHNKCYPRNLIVFRDGVGDGHIKVIRDAEMAPVEATLKRLVPEGVRIAFIIVQKRHIARFGLTSLNTNNFRKPTYNVDSGTVVDTHIVEPMIDGMILNSHFSQLGTSKPSKYTILRDDFGLRADQIERLCFFACHNCARTRKTISIPTSIRYADLCAYRAKQVTEAFQIRNPDQTETTSLTAFSGNTEQHEQEVLAKLSKVLTIRDESSEKLYYI